MMRFPGTWFPKHIWWLFFYGILFLRFSRHGYLHPVQGAFLACVVLLGALYSLQIWHFWPYKDRLPFSLWNFTQWPKPERKRFQNDAIIILALTAVLAGASFLWK